METRLTKVFKSGQLRHWRLSMLFFPLVLPRQALGALTVVHENPVRPEAL